MRALVLVSLAGVVATGCYDAHGTGRDADGAGPVPYDAAACPPIGGYARCGEGCGGDHACDFLGPRAGCSDQLGICLSSMGLSDDPRGFDTCSMGREPPNWYCWGGGACATDDPYPGRAHGYCVRDEYCDEVSSHLDGITCVWSDGSMRRTGAPAVEVCPEADERARFCGGPCGDCPWPDPFPVGFEPNSYQVACVGRSDRRDVGICAAVARTACTRERSADHVCTNGLLDVGPFPGEPCACLVQEDPNESGRFYDWGYATLADSCLRYQALYPGQVRCYDADWNPL